MSQFLLDADHLTLLDYGHPRVAREAAARPPGAVGFPVVAVEECLRGRLSAIARAKDGAARMRQYALLQRSLSLVQSYPVAPFDQAAEDQYQLFLGKRVRIGTRDQKIAAIALANNAVLVTRNSRDFGQIAGLMLEDWSV